MRITDAEGWLELALCPGTHELFDAGDGEAWFQGREPARLDWGVAGPVQGEVRLRRAEEDGR